MRLLGLDVGKKTIGVAMSDPTGTIATGLGVIRRTTLAKDLAEILSIAKANDVELLVVGLPRNMDGTLGPKAREVLEFCKELESFTGLAVKTQDERLSTVSSERAMLEADLSRRRRKQLVDKTAAAIILQSYLNSGEHRGCIKSRPGGEYTR